MSKKEWIFEHHKIVVTSASVQAETREEALTLLINGQAKPLGSVVRELGFRVKEPEK